jgi:hypothetical protein
MTTSLVNMSVLDGTVVHGWCGFVEKSNDVVCQQMVLNKLWIPDVLIDIIKDFLYINVKEVLRRFYQLHLNSSITAMWVNYTPFVDIYGRNRQTMYAIGHVYGGGDVQMQGVVCVTCGDFDHFHDNINGCCPQQFDLVNEPILLVEESWEEGDQEVQDETIAEINAEADEEIPEVTWAVDIPVASYDFQQAQAVLNVLQHAEAEFARQRAEDALWGRQPDEQYDFDNDIEAQWDSADQADYAEYQRELKMEAYLGR